MKNLQRSKALFWRRAVSLVVTAAAFVSLTACSHAMMMLHNTGARRPSASEFGLGPRSSANNIYIATLEPSRDLRPRQMQTMRVRIADHSGRAVEGATLTIGGDMPQHGHGLPTRPRMTRVVDAGTYEIEGVRFNMGGWWEFKVTIIPNAATTLSRST